MHDPLSVADLVHDELRQRRESGYDVAGIEADLGGLAADDHGRLEACYRELIMTKRRTDWHYDEPSLLEEIIAAMPAGNREQTAVAGRSREELADRILGGWQGRIAGCNLGKPVEDVYGWALPGQPAAAARLVFSEASRSHRDNGIYAAMWAAALVSVACVAGTVAEAFERSLDYVPARSRLAEALGFVHGLYRGQTREQALEQIRARFGHYSWVHSINNACLISAGLLWGEGDFASTVGLTVQGGWDTDFNAATAGSVVGTVLGAANLPAHFINPLHNRTRSAVFGYDNSRISDLARRTTSLAEHGLRSAAGDHASSAV